MGAKAFGVFGRRLGLTRRVAMGLLATVVFVFLLGSKFFQGSPFRENQPHPPAGSFQTLTVGGHQLTVGVAETPEAITRGLSGQPSLGDDEGLLFVFPQKDFYPFWMKEMRFSIDILWLDEEGRVVEVSRQLTPDSYPQIFVPKVPVRYVLEVKAGWADRYGIREGKKVSGIRL